MNHSSNEKCIDFDFLHPLPLSLTPLPYIVTGEECV